MLPEYKEPTRGHAIRKNKTFIGDQEHGHLLLNVQSRIKLFVDVVRFIANEPTAFTKKGRSKLNQGGERSKSTGCKNGERCRFSFRQLLDSSSIRLNIAETELLNEALKLTNLFGNGIDKKRLATSRNSKGNSGEAAACAKIGITAFRGLVN